MLQFAFEFKITWMHTQFKIAPISVSLFLSGLETKLIKGQAFQKVWTQKVWKGHGKVLPFLKGCFFL